MFGTSCFLSRNWAHKCQLQVLPEHLVHLYGNCSCSKHHLRDYTWCSCSSWCHECTILLISLVFQNEFTHSVICIFANICKVVKLSKWHFYKICRFNYISYIWIIKVNETLAKPSTYVWLSYVIIPPCLGPAGFFLQAKPEDKAKSRKSPKVHRANNWDQWKNFLTVACPLTRWNSPLAHNSLRMFDHWIPATCIQTKNHLKKKSLIF